MMSIGRNFAAVLLFAGMSAVALAQPAILIGDESVAPGGNADVSLDFLGDGTVTQLNFRFTYDPDVLTADITNCGGNSTVSPGQTSCSIPSPGEISVVHANISTTALADGTFGSVNFTAAADVSPGTVFPLEFSVESFSNADAEAVAPSGSEEGSVTIQCPTGESCYLSDPPIGSTITFGSAVVGQPTTPNEIIGVSNAQNDDASTFEVAGITSTGTDVTVNSPTTFPQVIPADGGNTVVDLELNCVPETRGNLSGTVTVDNDADNPAGTEDYPFTCTGLSPNVTLPAEVSISGTVDGADPSGAITVTNPQDDFTSTANNVQAAEGTGDAQITLTDTGPVSIAPDDSADFGVTCDSAAEGTFSKLITVSWDEPQPDGSTVTATDDVTVNCTVSDTDPAYNSDPAPGTELALSAPFGTQSAADGLDINNANTNPAADDLTIASATADDPVFSVTEINSSFAPDVGPDSIDDIEVTCTPEGVGTVTGTLTVETNDPNEPADGFQYPLSCTGTGEQVSVTPEGLNLGTVPPGTQTPQGTVNFTNNTLDQSIDVNCSVTDEAGVFTFTPDPIQFTLAAGAVEEAGFQCTPPDISTFTADVSCTTTGQMEPVGGEARGEAPPLNFTVSCSGRPLVVPTMSSWGLVVMSLMLLLAGGFATRRMMA